MSQAPIYQNTTSIPVAKAMQIGDTLAPAPPIPVPVPQTTAPLSETQVQKLMDQGFTRSLAESLDVTKNAFALRFWVVDNSGSMQQADGHRIVGDHKTGRLRMVDCTRWEEIRDTIEYHIRLASLIDAPTRFRFLNPPNVTIGPSQFSIAESTATNTFEGIESAAARNDEVSSAIRLMRQVRPGGCTPLTQHILEIHAEISRLTPALRRAGKRVAVIIATDGLPTDERRYSGHQYQQEFVESLRLLESLPVWLVIRLCTDDKECVDFYNKLDDILELSIDVLDDWNGEAKEVHDVNPWLNYSLTLHRMREMGNPNRLFDLIDNRSLTRTEIRDFCTLLLGTDSFDGIPDPAVDWKGFTAGLASVLARNENQKQWSTIKNKLSSLVSVKKLKRAYGHGAWSFF